MYTNRLVRLVAGLLLAGLVVAMCGATSVVIWFVAHRVSGELAARSEPLLNRIALVGNDGNVWIAAPDGGQSRNLTADARGYRFPTWAPDGRRLAFIGEDDEGDAALFLAEGFQSEPRILFTNSDSAPFYVYWAPDSRSVTFLTQERSSMSMRLAGAEDLGSGRVMAQGAPFYWVWSPEADQVFMHVGGAGALSEDAHLSFLENNEGAQRVELRLSPGRFQAPVWSKNGEFVIYIAADDGGNEAIYRTDVVTDRQSIITSLEGPAYIVLAPGDRHIAYLEVAPIQRFPAVGAAYIIGTSGETKKEILDDSVAAMYWSPDGRKLALLTSAQGDEGPLARSPGLAVPLPQRDRYRWWVYDVETETLELLTTFVPTLEFMQTVPFFDQYHLSLTFWSPDSRYFVITRRNTDGSRSSVWILDTSGQEAPRQIGDGTFAVWSWQ